MEGVWHGVYVIGLIIAIVGFFALLIIWGSVNPYRSSQKYLFATKISWIVFILGIIIMYLSWMQM